LIRFSWSTAAKLLENNAVKFDWGDEEEEPNQVKIDQMWGKKKATARELALTSIGLTHATDF
jgi:hypothetical protein